MVRVLDYPNIVGPTPPSPPLLPDALALARPRLCPNISGYLSVGQIQRMVRVSDNTTSLSSLLSAASSLSASAT